MERERSAYKTSSKVSGKTNTNVSSPHEMRLNLRLLKEGHKGMRLTVQICSGKSGEAASACCGKVHPSSPTPESTSVPGGNRMMEKGPGSSLHWMVCNNRRQEMFQGLRTADP